MKLFITGISTDVGKTVVAAIVTEALQADYWKPVQTGSALDADMEAVKKYISNSQTVIHSNAYAFELPASPHAAAKAESKNIDLKKIKEPTTNNHLVIEGAGGVLVPLNEQDCVIDLIQPDYVVVLVSKNYLGSINHTLLTIAQLKQLDVPIAGVIFVGEENVDTEKMILQHGKVTCLGRIPIAKSLDKEFVSGQAKNLHLN